jgi:hypothetical protein
MPRESPLDMNLSGEERRALEAIARRYTSPYCDVIGAKIVLLADLGPSMTLSRLGWLRPVRSSANGASDSPWPDGPAWRRSLEAG